MKYFIYIKESAEAVKGISLCHILPNRNRFMIDIASIEIFVSREMLFNRDVFRSTCNVLFRKTNIDVFC